MFHSRRINHKINKLRDRTLRIVYKDHFSSFEELLFKDKSVRVHLRNLQILATEIYNISNDLSSDIMQDIFETNSNFYNTQEILKQLDMDYRPSLTWFQKFGTQRDEINYLSE